MERKQLARFFAVILCGVLLCGCSRQEQSAAADPMTTTQAAAATERTYTITFLVGEQTICYQMSEGELPEIPEGVSGGYILAGWRDEAGTLIDPSEETIRADRTYEAVILPDMNRHDPYLFIDISGFIRPNDILTGLELKMAMIALAIDPMTVMNIPMPQAEEPVTFASLRKKLEYCFLSEHIDEVIGGEAAQPVTRSEFAKIINTLLGREDETVILKENAKLPGDIPLDNTDILEAALPHSVHPEGVTIENAVLEMPWTPGFTLLAGNLYYADETGVLLRDGQVGSLYFGQDGVYTSGDPELDAIVEELLWAFMLENPERSREDILYQAFEHTRKNFRYAGNLTLDFGATAWETEVAKKMFTSGGGNCYSYAAAFWALARGLGYEATCYSGMAMDPLEPHGWVVIEMAGARYLYDPQQEMVRIRDNRDYWGFTMYKIPESYWWQWRYTFPEE